MEKTLKFQVESTNTVSTLFRRLDANVEPTLAKRHHKNVDIMLSTLSTYFQPNFDVETTSYARWATCKVGFASSYAIFSNSVIIHETKTKKVSSVHDIWKSEEEILKSSPIGPRFFQEIGDSLRSTFK